MAASDVAETASNIAFEIATKAAIASAVAAVPFLGLPVINQLFTWCCEQFVKPFRQELTLYFVFKVIDVVVDHQREEYDRAKDVLRAALNSTNQEAIADAKEEYRKRLAELVKLRNA